MPVPVDWSKAPSWARYFVFTPVSACAYWCEKKPVVRDGNWNLGNCGQLASAGQDGDFVNKYDWTICVSR